MLKNTVIDKHKKMSQKAVVTEDTEKLANAMYVSFQSLYMTLCYNCALL